MKTKHIIAFGIALMGLTAKAETYMLTLQESIELAKEKSNAVTASAASLGAEMMVTACPLCRYNLEKNGSEILVVYFTELLAEALGVKEDTDE